MGEGVGSVSAAGGKLRLGSGLLSAAAVCVLLVVSLVLWTLPFQQSQLPFGEGDSAWHFAIGDSIASADKAEFRLPFYVGAWYYGFNRILGPFAPEYPPSSHVNYALMQVAGGERFVPVFIYRAFGSFLGALAVFFVISRLFGILPGFLAGLGLSFSLREQLTYLFGQQPTLTSVLIAPVASYAWYKYLVSFYGGDSGKGGGNNAYLFITFALLLSQYLLHLQGFVASAVLMAVFTAFMVVRFRKLPLSKLSIKPLIAVAVVFVAIAAPFAQIYLGAGDVVSGSGFGRFFEWGISPDDVQGSFPASFVEFAAEYPKVLWPFLVAGILLLLLRLFLVKSNVKELFLLSWLVGMYLAVHIDVFIPTGLNRLARMLVLENYIFYSLIALSVVWLPGTVSSVMKSLGVDFFAKKTAGEIATIAVFSPTRAIREILRFLPFRYILAAILALLLIFTSGDASYSTLKGAYGGIERITPVQADFAGSVLGKLPENAYVYDPSLKFVGQWRYPKMRWMLAISQRHVGRYDGGPIPGAGFIDPNEVYFMFDYSDLAVFASNPAYQQQAASWFIPLQQLEQQLFNNTPPIYDANNIRLYKHEPGGAAA
ncbi:hypothetical protein HYU18_01375 [Candidatus Woesearchaeota archaeon]|nr:hypothetical protein [Candidatus Woesearchaeota archaeon]